MELVKSYKKSSICLMLLNFLFLSCLFMLLIGIHSGGTDDVSEGTGFNILYLLFKGYVVFGISLIALVFGLIKKRLKVTTLFWLAYSVILIISSILTAGIPGDTMSSTGIMRPTTLEVNVSILLVIIDSLIALLFSFILSILTLRKKEIVGYIGIPINIVVLILYALIFLSMRKELFF